MKESMDLIVRIGLKTCDFAYGVHNDWLIRHTGRTDQDNESDAERRMTPSDVYRELISFLRHGKQFALPPGKIVLVTDAAERFMDSVCREQKKIGYIRLAPDSYKPESMTQLLEKNNGLLITENIDPKEPFAPKQCKRVLATFFQAGVTDVAVHSMYQFGFKGEEQRIIEVCEKTAPGAFRYHSLETKEYTSFLLTENRLLINLVIRGSFQKELAEVERACRNAGIEVPMVVLDGSGYCIDGDTALQDPLSVWQGGYAAAMMGAAIQYDAPDAIIVAPYGHLRMEDKKSGAVIIDRVKDCKPVTSGRTKRFFNFQVAGPFPGAVEFPEIPYRHRLLEAIHSINTSPGPLPVLDMTDGDLDLQDLDYPVYKVADFDSALLTGAQAAEFRKSFYCLVSPSEEKAAMQAFLRKEAARWLTSAGFSLSERKEDFSWSSTPYLNTKKEQLTLTLSGRLSPAERTD